ncbi:MAG: hypothetical protein QXF86_03460 [Candidatus Bilamarchaeaceae archaeon]
MKIVHKKIETLRQDAVKVHEFVRDYFKTKKKKEPIICIGVPLEEDIAKGEKLYYRYKSKNTDYSSPSLLTKIKHRVNAALMRGAYIWPSNKIYIFPSLLVNMSLYNIKPLLAHEITHYYQRGTPLALNNQTSDDPVEKLATTCALEGFAVLAEKEQKKQLKNSDKIKEGLIKFFSFTFLFVASQAVLCAYMASQLFSLIPKKIKIKISEFVDKHKNLVWFFSWPYKEGYKFAKKVVEELGSKNAFELVCACPPTQFSEIVDVDRYIKKRKTEIEMLKLLDNS